MFGCRDDASKDDENIEIVDLDNLNEHDAAIKTGNGEATPQKPPRFSSRQRYIQSIITVCLVGVVLSVLIFGNVTTRNKLLSIVSPLAPKPAESHYFYISGSPSWGHLYIDGKLLAHPPDSASRNSAPLSLPQGRHSIRWTAPPFTSQICTFSEPPDSIHDSCLRNHTLASPGKARAWVLVFPANLTYLVPSLRQQLVSTIQATLNGTPQSTSLLPGEAYAVDMISQYTLLAQVPLKATLHFQLDTGTGGKGLCSNMLELNAACTYAGQECYTICTTRLASDGPNAWNVLVVVNTTWDYTTLRGQSVAQGEPQIAGDVPLYEHLLPLRVTWDGSQWHVRLRFPLSSAMMQHFFDPVCDAAMDDERLSTTLQYAGPSHLRTSWHYAGGSNSALGCLGMVTLNKGPGQPVASQPVAYCLYRFGIYVAANALAHTYWPAMPVADSYEQQLAQQLAAHNDTA